MTDEPIDNNKLSEGALAALQALGIIGAQVNATSSKGYKQTSKSYSITPKQSANAMLDQTMNDLFGRNATAAEKRSFYAKLHKAEKKYATRSVQTGAGSTSNQTTTNYAFNVSDFLSSYVKEIAPKALAKGQFGGKARDAFNIIQKYAYDMGIPVNAKLISSDVINLVTGKSSQQNAIEHYRQQSIKMYGKFAERLKQDPNLTLRDVASGLINTYAAMLEKDPNTVGLDNPIIQDAMIHDTSISDLNKKIRGLPEYGYTDRSKAEASDLANSFKRTWGF